MIRDKFKKVLQIQLDNKLYYLVIIFLYMVLLISVFVKPWVKDEGSLLLSAQSYVITHKFIAFTWGIPFIFWKPWVWLLGHIGIIFSFNKYYLFRIPSFFLSVLSILYLNKLFTKLNFSYYSRLIAFSFLVLWLIFPIADGAVGVSVRPDTLYFFAICFSLYAAYLSIQLHDNRCYIISIFINAIAFSVHPNGIFAYLINACTLVFILKRLSIKQILFLFMMGLLSLCLFFLLFTFGDSLLANIAVYHRMMRYENCYHWYQEYVRYFSFVIYDFIFVVFILFSIFSLIFNKNKKEKTFINFLLLSFIIGIIYLFLLPKKWPVYVIILMPIFTIGLAQFVNYYFDKVNFFAKLFVLSLMILFLVQAIITSTINSVYFQSLFKKIYSTKFVKAADLVKLKLSNQYIVASSVWFPYLYESHFLSKVNWFYKQEPIPAYQINFYDKHIPVGAEVTNILRFEGKAYYVFRQQG